MCACEHPADEVQQVLLPMEPGTERLDEACQSTARLMLKDLMFMSSKKVFWAVTGSSMMVFWSQV